jgi:O-antigen/teichoic acid export membrane protein
MHALDFLRRLNSVAARNALSSMVSLIWLNLLSLFAIPVYIKLLGSTSWGTVAACSSLQLMFSLIDLGFSQIVPRWVAREANKPSMLHKYVRAFQRIYFSLAAAGFTALQLLAYPLATSWFQIEAEQAPQLELCIRLIAFQLFFQFLNSVYVGVWNGLQLQVSANIRTCFFGTLKHGLALASLTLAAPAPQHYAAAFALVALTECGASWWLTRRRGLLHREPDGELQVRPLLKEAMLLSVGIVLGLSVSQLDRVMLSKTVSVESFGIYVVVINLAMAFLALQTPLTRAFFPLLVQQVKETGNINALTFRRLILGNTIICICPALLVAVWAKPVIHLWISNDRYVELGALPLRLLLLAMCLNALYNCIYQVIIAHGRAALVIRINLCCLAVGIAIAAAVVLSGEVHLWHGSVVWVGTTATQLFLGTLWYLQQSKYFSSK